MQLNVIAVTKWRIFPKQSVIIMNKHFSARVESYSLGLTLYLAYRVKLVSCAAKSPAILVYFASSSEMWNSVDELNRHCVNSVLNVIAVVGTFNQEKAVLCDL